MGTLRNGLLAGAVAGVALAGCGGSSSSADVANVKQTVMRAFRALARGDGATLCSLATPSGQQTLAKAIPHATCPSVIKLVSSHLTAAEKAGLETVEINKVNLSGASATIADGDLTSAHGSLKDFLQPGAPPTKLAKQPDGSWKLTG